eukprot:TRINITY_DN10_c0_g1_i1.p1 TRINITY_DN10_c0_g1~~TRINITY_DN10_c0_g1_i1.p1  ORF type:complete len:387 (-),score=101.30 TRINITY_DN10_c0_g1_i1:77-1192(-)
MSISELEHLVGCITCHAWNGDRSKVAISPNSTQVNIYGKTGGSWALEHVLNEHDQVVTSIDWAPKTNRIVSSSQDRNAYVWTLQDGQWKPVLVILRINRAATHVRWSPNENKFAVATGAKCVSVCYFDKENDWWASKHIKKHRSTVTKVDWHPNNVLLATGSTDFKARVVGAWLKEDGKPPASVFGEKIAFGDAVLEMDAGGWVHAVKWSPSGNQVAYASHDSSISFANVSSLPPTIQKINLKGLPLRDLLFLSESSLVGVGDDCNPFLFSRDDNGTWTFVSEMDKKAEGGPAASESSSARKMFESKVNLGTESASDTKLTTQHQNSITSIAPVVVAGGVVSDFSTTGLDGNLIVWHTKALEAKFKNLKIK